MEPVTTAALISGGAGIVGGMMGGRAQARANRDQQAMWRHQLNWEEGMANTAYQRATQDLKQAGLNPALAYSQGGASTPSGSPPSLQAETQFGEGVSNSAKAAMEYQLLKNTVEKTDKEKKLLEAQANLTSNNAKVVEKNIPRAEAQSKIEGGILNWVMKKYDSIFGNNAKPNERRFSGTTGGW